MRHNYRSDAEAAERLAPFIGNILRTSGGGGSVANEGGGIAVHDLGGQYHTGTLNQAQAPWAATNQALQDHRATINAHLGLATNSGLTTSGGLLTLGTPSTLTATTTSAVSGSGHTHAISSTSNGDVNRNWLLESSANGGLELAFLRTALLTTSSGNTTIQPAGDLVLDPTGNRVQLSSSVSIQSDNYASQVTGWRATYDGQADFRYLFVDEMHAKSFIVDLEQALAGGQIITKSVAVLYSAFTAPAAGGSTTLTVRDLPSATGMAAFVNGDYVRIRNFSRAAGSLTIADCWGTVTLDTSYGTSGFDSATKTQRYTFTRSTAPDAGTMSTSTVVAADAIILDYGTSGNGYHEVNAIDGAYGANSPYSQVVTWTTHPRNASVKVRTGNISGVISGTDYGMQMGTAVGADATTTFDFRASTGSIRLGAIGSGKPNLYFDGTDLHIRQNTTPVITLASDGSSYFAGAMTIGTSGGIYQGTGTPSSPTTGLKIWNDSGIGRIAGYNSGTTQWYANTDGRMYAGGGGVMLDARGVHASSNNTSEGYKLYSNTPMTDDTYRALWMHTVSGATNPTNYLYTGKSTSWGDGSNLSGTLNIEAASGSNIVGIKLDGPNQEIEITKPTGYVSGGGYTQTGYINIRINGTMYKVLCSNL